MGKPTPSQRPASGSRRSALRLLMGSACVGAAWGTGFTALSSVRGPSATVCGQREWQLTLIEAGRCRALILMGIPDDSIAETLTRIMGSFRQRIDLVIGAANAIEQLPPEYQNRWNVQQTLVLGGANTRSLLATTASIASPVDVDLSDQLTLSMTPVIRDEWNGPGQSNVAMVPWIVSARAGGATVRLAERLDDIEGSNLGPSAVAIAPKGDLRSFWSFEQNTAVAMNGDQVPLDVISLPEPGNQSGFLLVSVFADDFAHLAYTGQGVGLPDWARSVKFIDMSE